MSASADDNDPVPSPPAPATATSHEDAKADIACLICRSRKVRCDKTLPDCRNCIRLGIPCPRYSRDSEFISRKELQKSAEAIFKAAGVEKRRVGSCEECRSSKHRCTKTRPSCRRCILRNLPCVYPSRHDRDGMPLTPNGAGPNSKQFAIIQHSPAGAQPMSSPTYPPQHHQQFPQYQQQQHMHDPQRQAYHSQMGPAPNQLQQHHRPPHPSEAFPSNHNRYQSMPQTNHFNTQQYAPNQHHPHTNGLQSPTTQKSQQPRPQFSSGQHQGYVPRAPRSAPGHSLPMAFGLDTESLYSDRLPADELVQRRLMEMYFERSAPLRVMSFIHKPSFMQSFDRASVAQDYGEPLLYAMCALGARHIFFDHVAALAAEGAAPIDMTRIPGEAWAERARQEVLREIHAPTVHHIMTMVLLCDYGLREDRNAMVFVLIAFLYRMVRLLSLDDHRQLEAPTSPSEFIQRECEIRLVWACYYIDVLVGTGVDKNLCWRDGAPNIPLPCSDEHFFSQTPGKVFMIDEIERTGLEAAVPQLGLQALSILVVRLRSKVMKLIRNPEPNEHIWDQDSSFLKIITQLDTIYQHLPEKYHLTDLNIYNLKDKGNLGAVFVLHLLIHAVIFDLTRTSLAGFNFPISADFKHAPDFFRAQCQERCRFHADQVSHLLRRGMHHGRAPFDDVFCADAALESAKIQIVFASTVNRDPQVTSAIRSNLCTNIELLKTLNRSTETKSQVIRALLPICTLFGFRDIAEKYSEPNDDQSDSIEFTGSADMHHLSRLAAFRRGRSELQGAQSSGSQKTGSSSNPNRSPLIQASGRIAPRSATSNTGAEYSASNMPPVSAATYADMVPAHDGAPGTPGSAATAPQRSALQLMPSAGVTMHTSILQPSIEDYIRTADEMSNLLTWNMPDLPPGLTGDVMLSGMSG